MPGWGVLAVRKHRGAPYRRVVLLLSYFVESIRRVSRRDSRTIPFLRMRRRLATLFG